jgi:hypothetical protein
MRHRRYRVIALLLGSLALGCDATPTETPGAEKPPNSGSAGSGLSKATLKAASPLPTKGLVD